jgi:hypothetical protein
MGYSGILRKHMRASELHRVPRNVAYSTVLAISFVYHCRVAQFDLRVEIMCARKSEHSLGAGSTPSV